MRLRLANLLRRVATRLDPLDSMMDRVIAEAIANTSVLEPWWKS